MEQKRKREWDTLHPGDHNPYADLPELRILTFDLGKSLPTSYRYATTEMAFNFTEFFRVWTGDPAKDFRPLPSGAQVGDFVHEADVRSFLHLISSENSESNYPFSTPEYREMFRHTLWMIPGVKEAAALSRLLKEEGSGFEAYKIANVAGDGDVEMPYDNALQLVRKVIHENRYTITISCGKLTTGVTVPEWTAVMMLTGSANTSAPGYMQTIFRVQSAGVLDGKQKERCYVFDFAPDRALNVLSEVNRVTKRGKTNEEEYRKALGDFLNFCPVIAVDGTQMTEYSVPKMMRQIKRLTVDKAIKSGFDDESVYKQDTGIVMDEEDVELFHTLSDKLSEQKAARKETKVHINNQGLTNEEYEEASKLSNKPKRERSKKEGEPMKFDAIVGNPPYQEMNGGGKGYSAKPVYNYFVHKAKAIDPHYISMITPSRWFSGGKGLDDFRAEMLQDKHLRKIVDYADNEALFSNVSIVGGVNYFLWDSSYNGDCEVTSIRGENRVTLNRDLSEYDIFIRNNNALQLIRRMEASGDRKMDDVVYPRNVFGISSDLRGQDDKDEEHPLALFSSQKSNSMAMSYISGEEVQKQHELIGKYKVIMGKVVPRGGEVGVDPSVGYRVTSTLQVLSPGSVFTDSYLLLAAFDGKDEAIHFAEYMCLKFPRFLLHETYSSMNISKQNFRFVPFLDYSKEWTDKELFERYGCNEEEVSMIESIIRPMEYVLHE